MGGLEIRVITSCYRNWDKLGPDGCSSFLGTLIDLACGSMDLLAKEDTVQHFRNTVLFK